jgi:hypothetical protein
MKSSSLKSFLSIFILSIPLCLKADLTINMEGSASQHTVNSVMKLASGNIRVDADVGGSVILIPADKKMIVLIPQQKQYLVIPSDFMKSAAAEEVDDSNPELTRTGKMDTINGFSCEQVFVKMKDGKKSELWISKQAPNITEFMQSMTNFSSSQSAKMGLAWLKMMIQNRELSTFPIRTISYDTSGAEVGRMTVKSFDEGKIRASEFSAPSDYTEQKMPGMSSSGGGGMDMEAMKKMQQQMMKGGKLSPEQMEQLQKMAEQMQQNQ